MSLSRSREISVSIQGVSLVGAGLGSLTRAPACKVPIFLDHASGCFFLNQRRVVITAIGVDFFISC